MRKKISKKDFAKHGSMCLFLAGVFLISGLGFSIIGFWQATAIFYTLAIAMFIKTAYWDLLERILKK